MKPVSLDKFHALKQQLEDSVLRSLAPSRSLPSAYFGDSLGNKFKRELLRKSVKVNELFPGNKKHVIAIECSGANLIKCMGGQWEGGGIGGFGAKEFQV